MKQRIRLTIVTCVLALAGTARAEQGGSGHYVSGATASFIDEYPGQPGFGAEDIFFYYNNANANASRGLPFGGNVALNVDASVYANTPLVFYQAPVDILGGNPVFAVAIPYVWMKVTASGVINTRLGSVSPSKSDTANGIGDIEFWPVWLGWTNGDFKYDVRCAVYAPSGGYDKNNLANVGLGYWTFEPELSFSWISSKIGTEFTLFAGMDFNTKNTDDDYQSGDIFHLDATVAEHVPLLGGFAGVGANGFYYKQFTGDSGSGARLGAFETESYGVGPVGSYTRKFGKTDLVFEVKWLPQMHVENTLKGNYIWAKLVLLF
jgi:hypothetical protein